VKVINLHQPFNQNEIPGGDIVLAMGFFDGVHRGHQAVIAEAKQRAKALKLPLAVLTYDHHPSIVYTTTKNQQTYLSSLPRKLSLLEAQGVDLVYVVSFTSALSALGPQQFVDDYLVRFHTKVAVAGFDHTYGPRDISTMDKLAGYAKSRFEVVIVKSENENQEKISSTKIRYLLDDGEIAEANELFGYAYQTTGLVVHGEARGRTLGFPTANIDWPIEERMPRIGVYAVQLKVSNQWYNGMASIGHNVTFGDARPKTLEINLFDFNQAIYGENVEVRWVSWLRDEVKYTTVENLIKQLQQDEIDSRKILERYVEKIKN
jgi:riboflavin kinase/FMN adenylyltransferase